MVRVNSPFLEVLDKGRLDSLHSASLEVLRRTGIIMNQEESLNLFRAAGAEVDYREKRVRLPENLVHEALRKAPNKFAVYGRDPQKKILMEKGEVAFGPSFSGAFILDLETGQKRKANLNDEALAVKLIDALENVSGGSVWMYPSDIPEEILHVSVFLTELENTTKPLIGDFGYGSCRGRIGVRDIYRMASVALRGEETLAKRPLYYHNINSLSPLQFDAQQIEGVVEAARLGLPVVVTPEIMSGLNGPATIAGTLVQQNAEVLSCIVLTQLVNPGTPVAYGTVSTILDMRTSLIAYGAIELGLINVATAQIARYYGLPCRGSGFCSDSKNVDVQAGYEAALTGLLAALGGINVIHYSVGNLESSKTFSFEKSVIDHEIIGMIARFLRGIDVEEETLAVDVLDRVGPGHDFLREAHTRKHFPKEHFMVELADRLSWDASGGGRKDILDRAKDKVRKILKEHQPQPLDKDVKRELQAIIEEVKRRELNR